MLTLLKPRPLDELRRREKEIFASSPKPQACESCWCEWNARHGYTPEDDDYIPPAGSSEEPPAYNPACPICYANYQNKLALWRAGSFEAYAV